jgi:amino acid transporter
MVWVVRVTSWSSVVNVLVSAIGFYWPVVTTGLWRTTVISFVVLVIMALNIRGIKQSSIAVNALTIGKLTPLGLFILIGLPHVSLSSLRPDIR